MINEISIKLHDDVYRNDHHITFKVVSQQY